MKKLTLAELFELFPKVRNYIEKRLQQEFVDGMIVFERTEEDAGKGRKIACMFGATCTIKRWQDADGKYLGDTSDRKTAVAYYEKPLDRLKADVPIET